MVEFILGRANYWAIIGLMMVGLYITFQSTNLIKRLVGLSVFQTSVFLFYITLGKVAGGSAPILYGKDALGHGDSHGGGHGSHSEADDHGRVYVPDTPVEGHDAGQLDDEGSPIDPALVDDSGEHTEAAAGDGNEATDHGSPVPDDAAEGSVAGVEQLELTGLQEVYSNPLPHVLILTAIVVGVATLSVGLALVVRIRESYGTIESDEVRLKDISIADAQDADDPEVIGSGE
ncbi:MAG: cation:proton antiporter subunit C [Pseudomonadota bacterium]